MNGRTQNIQYRPRIADELLRNKLDAKGAVLVRGPKWCGKTTTTEQYAESVVYMSQPGVTGNYDDNDGCWQLCLSPCGWDLDCSR